MIIDVLKIQPGDYVGCGDLYGPVKSVKEYAPGVYGLQVAVKDPDGCVFLSVYRDGSSAKAPGLQYDITMHNRVFAKPIDSIDVKITGQKKYWMITTRTVRRDDDEYERYVTTVTDLNPVEHALQNCDYTHTTTVVWAHETDLDTYLRLKARYAISNR